MSDATANANSSASIPIYVTGNVNSEYSFNGQLTAPNLQPLPQHNDSDPYGGTTENPHWFWDKTLDSNDIVCGTSNWTIRQVCCPRSIGIPNGDPNAGANCRLHATQENSQWWMNCTHEIAQANGGGDVASACWPLEKYMESAADAKYADLNFGQEKVERCTSLAQASSKNNYTMGNNYTDICCEQVMGHPSSYFSDVELGDSTMETNRSAYMAMDCNLKDKKDWTAFMKCMDQYTWAVCREVGGANTAGVSALVVAAAALALLV